MFFSCVCVCVYMRVRVRVRVFVCVKNIKEGSLRLLHFDLGVIGSKYGKASPHVVVSLHTSNPPQTLEASYTWTPF